jgi:hypothetical protein
VRVLFNPGGKLEEQRHLKGWSGGRFNLERFDLAKSTKRRKER